MKYTDFCIKVQEKLHQPFTNIHLFFYKTKTILILFPGFRRYSFEEKTNLTTGLEVS